MEFDFVTIMKDWGPFLSIMAFFVWRDYKREDRLTTNVEHLNEFVREKLMVALEHSSSVVERNNEIMLKWKTPTSVGR